MRKQIVFLLFLVVFLFAEEIFSQQIYSKYSLDEWIVDDLLLVDDGKNSFFIDIYRTTNKEYLTYVTWLFFNYSDNLSIFYNALPDTPYYDLLFSSKYAILPVRGVDLVQARKYAHWKSDRYNEVTIKSYKVLSQIDLGNTYAEVNYPYEPFYTETYLCGKYDAKYTTNRLFNDPENYGGRHAIHSDYILLPSIYVANSMQLQLAASLSQQLEQQFEASDYIMSISDYWLELYLSSYHNILLNYQMKKIGHPLSVYYSEYVDKGYKVNSDGAARAKKFVRQISRVGSQRSVQFYIENALVDTLDFRLGKINRFNRQIYYSNQNPRTVFNPFNKNDFGKVLEKDSLGFMPFIWIADELDGTPVLVKKDSYYSNGSNSTEHSGFYCVMNLPYSYLVKRAYKKYRKPYRDYH